MLTWIESNGNAYLYAVHPITDVVKRRCRRDVIDDEYAVRLAKIVPCETSIPVRDPQATYKS